MAVATPGAGKTTFALRLATELLDARIVRKVTVVAPTEHLKHQWADAAARVGIRLDPNYKNAQGRLADHYDGVALTYAQVAANPALHANRTANARTFVILDEVHHGGDALSWGDAIHEAFDLATRRLSLTGTPFRSDTAPIPFVRYDKGPDGIRRSVADYTYGYGQALRDHVVRPVIFLTYAGQMRWRTKMGDEIAANLGEAMTKDMTAQAWRTALDPQGQWIPSVLAAADKRLSEVRRTVPDAGGLVIASDQDDARAYAGHLARITGVSPTVVLSDDSGAGARIEEFSESDDRWMVAVRMVSEGVDVPRLAVGVYATSTQTPYFLPKPLGATCAPVNAVKPRPCSSLPWHPCSPWRTPWKRNATTLLTVQPQTPKNSTTQKQPFLPQQTGKTKHQILWCKAPSKCWNLKPHSTVSCSTAESSG